MRTRGIFDFSANLEVKTQAPLDARTVVATEADLVDPNTWKDSNNKVWLFNGLVVVAADTGQPYVLKNASNYTQLSSWFKITEAQSQVIADIQARLNLAVFEAVTSMSVDVKASTINLVLSLVNETVQSTQIKTIPAVTDTLAGLMLPAQKRALEKAVSDVALLLDTIRATSGSEQTPVHTILVSDLESGILSYSDSLFDKTRNKFQSALNQELQNSEEVYATYTKAPDGTLSNISLFTDSQKTKPVTPASNRIYIDVSPDSSYQFRWTGSVYKNIGSPMILGEVQGTAYDGLKGKQTADAVALLQDKIPVTGDASVSSFQESASIARVYVAGLSSLDSRGVKNGAYLYMGDRWDLIQHFDNSKVTIY